MKHASAYLTRMFCWLCLMLVGTTASVSHIHAQVSSITLDTSYVSIPDQLVADIRTILQNKPANLLVGSKYALTSGRIENKWALISVAALDGPYSSTEYTGVGDSTALIIATQFTDELWQGDIQGTTAFTDMVERAPTWFISNE